MKRDSNSMNLSKSHREFKKTDSLGTTGGTSGRDEFTKSAANTSPNDSLAPSYSMGDVFSMSLISILLIWSSLWW
jgi:hypothetical protein